MTEEDERRLIAERTVAKTERWIVVLMAGRLGDYMAFGIELDWSIPRLFMFRLKFLLWAVGFDFGWRAKA